jgi:hypothetical protein
VVWLWAGVTNSHYSAVKPHGIKHGLGVRIHDDDVLVDRRSLLDRIYKLIGSTLLEREDDSTLF